MDTGEQGKTYLFFHLFGAASASSLFLIVLYVLPGALHGDFSVVRIFLREHPGIEPFLIFLFPVILIVGPLWVWKILHDFRKRRGR